MVVTMLTKMDSSALASQNPWWSDPHSLEEDPHLQALDDQPVPWMPRLAHRFRLDADRVYSLRGPRQVGKTTLVKILIRRLLREERVDPRAVFYYSCDHVRDARELDDLVEAYLRWQAPFRLDRRYLFLDEVSAVEGWSRGVRALANRGRLRRCTVVLTGSHALDVVRETERLPGRRGESATAELDDLLDKVLLPMKFAEYAETQRPGMRRVFAGCGLLHRVVRREAVDHLFAGAPSEAWSSLLAHQEALQALLSDYLLTGGFPRPLNDLRRTERISRETYDLYIRVLAGDLARFDHDERTARDILAAIVERLGTPVSWRTLASEAGVGSHVTVQRYVDALERTYAIQTVYQYDVRHRRRSPRKERKLYVSDPFMFHAIRGWALGLVNPFESARDYVSDPPRRGRLLESVVADHLARFAFGQAPASLFDAYERVLFWRSRKGWEVDFVLRLDGRPKAIQVTLTRPKPEDRRALRSLGGGVVLTERGAENSVPLAAFLALV